MTALLLIAALLPLGGDGAAEDGAAAAAAEEVGLFLNGERLVVDVPPFLKDGRARVPVRAVFEALGADVIWESAQQKVTVAREESRLELFIGEPVMLIDGAHESLTHPPLVLEGRTLVPVRALAENLGVDVSWDAVERAIHLQVDDGRFGESRNLPQSPPPYYEDVAVDVDTYGIKLGDPVWVLQEKLGQPSRVDLTIYGYSWWVYKEDLSQYLLVGIRQDRVISIYAGGGGWRFGLLSRGSTRGELQEHFEPLKKLAADREGMYYQLLYPAMLFDHMAATFYVDGIEGTIAALYLEDIEVMRTRRGIFYDHYHARQPVELQRGRELEEAERGLEQRIFDLANVARAHRGLPLLKWCEKTSEVSRAHSREMFCHDYFSHRSPLSGSMLSDRLHDAGVEFRLAGENLARGQQDAMEIHHDLMSSPGHRANIIQKEFCCLGVGVYGNCCTQKFFVGF